MTAAAKTAHITPTITPEVIAAHGFTPEEYTQVEKM